MAIETTYNRVRSRLGFDVDNLPNETLVDWTNILNRDFEQFKVPVLLTSTKVNLQTHPDAAPPADSGASLVINKWRERLQLAAITRIQGSYGTFQVRSSELPPGRRVNYGRNSEYAVYNGQHLEIYGADDIYIRGYQKLEDVTIKNISTYSNPILDDFENLYISALAFRWARTARLDASILQYEEGEYEQAVAVVKDNSSNRIIRNSRG